MLSSLSPFIGLMPRLMNSCTADAPASRRWTIVTVAERTVPIRSVTLSQRRRSPRSGAKMLTVSAIDSVRKICEGEGAGEGAVEVRPRVETRARGTLWFECWRSKGSTW